MIRVKASLQDNWIEISSVDDFRRLMLGKCNLRLSSVAKVDELEDILSGDTCLSY